MKKSIIGVILAILFIFIGIFIGRNIKKINIKPPTTQSESKGITSIVNQARPKASTIEDKENQRVEIENVGMSKYQSIVILQSTDSNIRDHGTGFIVGKNKILTNKHVTEGLENNLLVRLRNENGEFIDFKAVNVINPPDETDLSIVEVAPNDSGQNIGDNIKMLEFATQEEISNVKVDDFVHVVGYPGDKIFSTLWYSPGKILHTDGFMIISDSLIAGGNSGSPLLNKDGKIIGLVNAGDDEDREKVITFGFLLDKNLYEFIKSNI